MKDKISLTLHASGFHNILATGPSCRSYPNYDLYKDYMHARIHTITVQIMVYKKLKNVEYFNYVDSMITDDARYTREIKSRNEMAKAEFNKKTVLFSSLFLDSRKKL